MYWTNNGIIPHSIWRANLDGSGVEAIVTSGLNTPSGIAVNSAEGKVYWTDAGFEDEIQRANLDGSGVEDLVTEGLLGPLAIALLLN